MMKAFGVGRFVADPELKTIGESDKQTVVCKFTLAINEFRKVAGERKKYAHFFDFEIWDKAAELIHKWRKQGDLIEFCATPRQQKWNDKETGEPRSRIVFRMDDFTFLPRSTNPNSQQVEEEEEEDDF